MLLHLLRADCGNIRRSAEAAEKVLHIAAVTLHRALGIAAFNPQPVCERGYRGSIHAVSVGYQMVMVAQPFLQAVAEILLKAA